MEKITEKTLIPISLVAMLIGGVVWLSVMWYRTDASAKDIHQMKRDMAVLNDEVIDRLARIETKLDIMSEGEHNGRGKSTRAKDYFEKRRANR